MIWFLYFLACGNEELPCASDEAAHSMVFDSVKPDFQLVNAVYPDEPADDYLAGEGDITIEAWDCIDLSWWSPVEEAKVVQVWSDRNTCGEYTHVEMFTYNCDSFDGPDAPYRDYDGDGLMTIEGDCDDHDAAVGTCTVAGSEDGL